MQQESACWKASFSEKVYGHHLFEVYKDHFFLAKQTKKILFKVHHLKILHGFFFQCQFIYIAYKTTKG